MRAAVAMNQCVMGLLMLVLFPLSWGEALAESKFTFHSPANKKASMTTARSSTTLDSAQRSTSDSANAIIPCAYVAETNLPTDVGHFRLRAYRISESDDVENLMANNKYMGNEPCVIYCTQSPPGTVGGSLTDGDGELVEQEAVPVRIHDQCFTSEVFRSRRCDCKEQLRLALEYIQRNGGAIIYLQQEGRGIGLANKIAAYALQDAGMDTVEANVHLGFPEDCRQYGVVPDILKDMGIASIQLMTNNPRKTERLRDLGIDVVGTIPIPIAKANKYNRRYLETKALRMNHENFNQVMGLETGSLKTRRINGSMMPRPAPLPDKLVNSGDAAASFAVATALIDDDDEEDVYEFQRGVVAAEDGYCFGRQSVENAIEAIGKGELVVVVDDMDRENEGDFIMAADLATPEKIAEIVRFSSGVLCIGMEGGRMDELNIPAMVADNEDPKGTAFGISIDASTSHGITTGISAFDRAKTFKLLASKSSKADDFVRPGHIFPLRAKSGGVLERDGHTEAAVDLSRLAGRHPSGILCEIVSEENPTEMARLPELKEMCRKRGYVITSIADIAQYRRDTESS
mmetsp:Transcript_14728/g.22844  ORF Transcript_14728/g.22844 Transcript_14728/m.22844 type:complete len:573 (+) Transcript_14728:122-1840(+)|eukprot:CAMPEP_0196820652 /NCGR_PEP_ID=MMETSP1362-20130617/76187_1 /TAXON_ID=163516 /ORGANISM="Leptocylindrus danicus, Strain CCMP1856" /LENGTH=572 /DNA_ID=CAMNT_0042199615 /DNA_START=67 /DNA_END=1785 /DNA_ORIENTATION=+